MEMVKKRTPPRTKAGGVFNLEWTIHPNSNKSQAVIFHLGDPFAGSVS
jgi:hypothetical protein